MNGKLHFVALVSLSLLFAAIACSGSDPKKENPGGAGGAGGGGGGQPPTDCSKFELPTSFVRGKWSREYGVLGLSNSTGLPAKVYDLTANHEGKTVVAGHFEWMLGESVDVPLIHFPRNQWTEVPGEWGQFEVEGFSAVSYRKDGVFAVATSTRAAPHHGEILVNLGEGLLSVGTFQGHVRALAWYEDQLWVAGNFQLGEKGLEHLAIWDASPAGATWWHPPGGEADGPIYELFHQGGELFVGGAFDNVGGQQAKKVASWDSGAWTSYDLDGPGAVYALEYFEGALIAGGTLPSGTSGSGGLYRYEDGAWSLLEGGVSAADRAGVVSALAIHADELYLTGCFERAGVPGPGSIPAVSIASLSRDGAWTSLDQGEVPVSSLWEEPFSCGDEGPDSLWEMQHQRLLSTGSVLLIGGSFAGVGGTHSHALVGINDEGMLPQLQWIGKGVSGEVVDIQLGGRGCQPFILTKGSHARSVHTPTGVYNHGGLWEPVSEAPLPEGVSCEKIAARPDGRVFLGCNDHEGARLFHGKTLPPNAEEDEGWIEIEEVRGLSRLFDMASDAEGGLWLAGGDADGGYVAKWQSALEPPPPPPWDPIEEEEEEEEEEVPPDELLILEDRFDKAVTKIALEPAAREEIPNFGEHRLVVAGDFTTIGELEAAGAAHWEPSGWTSMGDGLAPHRVLALSYGDSLGIFASTSYEGDDSRPIVAHWDGSAWVEIATEENGLPPPRAGMRHTVRGLIERSGKLVVAGEILPEVEEQNVWVWDGRTFNPVAGGARGGAAGAMAIGNTGIFFGGTFLEVGPPSRVVISSGVGRLDFPPKPIKK